MAQTLWSPLKLGNHRQGDYYSSNRKMKKIWEWNLKPLKKSEKSWRLEKKFPNFKQPKDTIQRFNHKTFNRATSYGESEVKPEKNPQAGKFGLNWEDPFRVTTNLDNGAYRLQELDGKAIPKAWNATHLKFYFSWPILKTQCCTLFLLRSFVSKIEKSRFWLRGVLTRHIWGNKGNLYSIRYIE